VGERLFARVAMPVPLRRTFDFLVPDTLRGRIVPGVRVAVRFADRPAQGIVVALARTTTHDGPFEPVDELLAGPRFSEYGLGFATAVAERYLTPVGLLVNRALPRRRSGRATRHVALAVGFEEALDAIDTLDGRAPRQAQALRRLLAATGPLDESALREALGPRTREILDRLVEQGFVHVGSVPPASGTEAQPAGLHDIAPSPPPGDVFLLRRRDRLDDYGRAVEDATRTGLALVLAPTILHAEALHAHLKTAAPGTSALYHSGLSDGARGDAWERAREGSLRLLVGTRSAVFVPAAPPATIIVDDEHAPGHRQEDMAPHYHVRDAARLHRGASLILGSAAPSLSAWHAMQHGAVAAAPQPEPRPEGSAVQIVDQRSESAPLGGAVLEAMRRARADGDRILLAVPRRGFFQAIVCKSCGRPLRCPRCAAALSYRTGTAQLVCRACGHATAGARCAACGSRALRFVGHGAERIEAAAHAEFPDARVFLVDVDALRRRADRVRARQAIQRDAQILVATPLIATGPAIDGVRLAAALDVDALLARPEYRAAERTFQYLDGLRGRLDGGTLMVQTFCPDHPVLAALAEGDYAGFARRELAEREALGYPPFVSLLRVFARGRGGDNVAQRAGGMLNAWGLDVLGPVAVRSPRRAFTLYAKVKSGERARTLGAQLVAELPGIEVEIDEGFAA